MIKAHTLQDDLGAGGFTLVELIVVIAIMAIIASFAVPRFSGIRERSAKVYNMANLTQVGKSLETFMVANKGRLNRLDLPYMDYLTGTAGSFSADSDGLLALVDTPDNIGLHPALYSSVSIGGSTFPPLLAKYFLMPADVAALNKMGLTYLMRFNDGGVGAEGDDGELPTGSPDDPDTCLSLSTAVAAGMAVPVINPAAVVSDRGRISPVGALTYQACGQDVRFTTSEKVRINDVMEFDSYDHGGFLAALQNGDGILLAFGIGQYASVVGSTEGGLDSAPISPEMNPDTYRRYFLLIRLKQSAGSEPVAEFAGIMDPQGRTMKQLRLAAKD